MTTTLNNVLHHHNHQEEQDDDDDFSEDMLSYIFSFLDHKNDIPNLYIACMAQQSLRTKMTKIVYQTFQILCIEESKYKWIFSKAPKDIKDLWDEELARFLFQNNNNNNNGKKQKRIPRISKLCIILEFLNISKTITCCLLGGGGGGDHPYQQQQQQIPLLWPSGISISSSSNEQQDHNEFSVLFVSPYFDRKLIYKTKACWFPSFSKGQGGGKQGLKLQKHDRRDDRSTTNNVIVNEIIDYHHHYNVGLIIRFDANENNNNNDNKLNRYLCSGRRSSSDTAFVINKTANGRDLFVTSKAVLDVSPETRRSILLLSQQQQQQQKSLWLLNLKNINTTITSSDNNNNNNIDDYAICYWKQDLTPTAIHFDKLKGPIMGYMTNIVQTIHKEKILERYI